MTNKSYNDFFCSALMCLSILVIFGCSDESDAQNDRIECLFGLSDFGQCTIPMDSQGMDVFDDKYLFQGSYVPQKECCGIVTVDINDRRILGEFTFGQNFPLIHMNNINCGKKYDETDKFPMLYISEALGEQRCFIVRLDNDASHYSVVQTIKYDGDLYSSADYRDWFLDNENGYIYAYGRTNFYSGEYCCLKFELPLFNTKSIILSDSDIVDAFTMNTGLIIPQGTKCDNGILYTVYGYNTNEYPSWFMKYDLSAKQIILIERLGSRMGEPEAISLFQHKVLISNNSTSPTYWVFKDS